MKMALGTVFFNPPKSDFCPLRVLFAKLVILTSFFRNAGHSQVSVNLLSGTLLFRSSNEFHNSFFVHSPKAT